MSEYQPDTTPELRAFNQGGTDPKPNPNFDPTTVRVGVNQRLRFRGPNSNPSPTTETRRNEKTEYYRESSLSLATPTHLGL